MTKSDPVEAHWPSLARLAGISDDMPVEQRLLSRHVRTSRANGAPCADMSQERAVIALQLADGRRVVMKIDEHSDAGASGHFMRSIAAQKVARVRLQGNLQGLGVPRVLSELPDVPVALMEWAPGRQGAALVEEATDNHQRRAVLDAAGRWLSGFHDAGRVMTRPYQTRHALLHLASVRDGLARRRGPPGAAAGLGALVDAVEASAPRFDGRPARHAQAHGDYILRNIQLDDSTVFAFDFEPEATAPAGYDVVRFLVDYATLFGDHGKAGPGQLLSAADSVAFFGGYRFARPDDAAIGFLTGVQLVHDWMKLPIDPERHSLIEAVRLNGIRETAARLFPHLRGQGHL